ncbi:MAG: 30S ribosomal protein S2 [Parcubacteria group bacterium]|nr:30S ribosomal protein S2 [Parcubacteria group bacterium]
MESTLPREEIITNMMRAGVHFGHVKSKFHPGMAPYIFTVRNNIHIINLEKTAEMLERALEYLSQLVGEGKTILLVGTKPPIRRILEETAQACGMPFVSTRWLGGTFTNYPVIVKRIEYVKDLEAKKASGELEKYTKREQLRFDEEIRDLNAKFSGIKNLTQLPDAVFVIDIDHDKTVVREATLKKIPVVAIVDTNTNPQRIAFPIPANDDAVTSVTFILDRLREAILAAKEKRIQSSSENVGTSTPPSASDAPSVQPEHIQPAPDNTTKAA